MTVSPLAAPTSDQSAIAAVIRAETEAFANEDFDSWRSFFVQDDRMQDIHISGTAGMNRLQGWPAISRNMKEVMERHIGCDMTDFGQENLQITVSGDLAWVVYDGWVLETRGKRVETLETRILERLDGSWKIVYLCSALKFSDDRMRSVISVDQNGLLIRAEAIAQSELRDHPYLTISAGRLRARRSVWDKQLQAALASAAEHHGFFETQSASHQMDAPVEFPVVLGTTDDGGVAVIRLSVRDGVTYVALNPSQDFERRIRVAQTVFGLSDGQTRVARLIALGEGPKSLAATLGISVNTARTHLSRLYDKTGVRTQAALVRLLLSVG